jgi:ABC-type uncharacterized transport system substrate-binding protein
MACARLSSLQLGCLLALAVGACAPAALPVQRVVPDRAQNGTHTLVMVSELNPIYDEVLTGFEAAHTGRITVLSGVNGDRVSVASVRATLEREAPDLVFTLGDAATRLARDAHLKQPVLFAMVVNPDDLELISTGHFFGVSMVTPPGAAFTRFKGITPGLARVLAPYNTDSVKTALSLAQTELASLGVALIPVGVADLDDLKHALKEREVDYDAVWMVPDPVVVNRASFDFMRDTLRAAKKPLLTTVSEKFTRAGALMSVSADFKGMGSLAALLAYRVLKQGQLVASVGLRPPVGAKLSINLSVAAEQKIALSPQVMMMVGQAFE